MADYDAALAVEAKPAPVTLYARGVAKQKKGDKAGGDADIQRAIGLAPRIADLARRYGIIAEAAPAAQAAGARGGGPVTARPFLRAAAAAVPGPGDPQGRAGQGPGRLQRGPSRPGRRPRRTGQGLPTCRGKPRSREDLMQRLTLAAAVLAAAAATAPARAQAPPPQIPFEGVDALDPPARHASGRGGRGSR